VANELRWQGTLASSASLPSEWAGVVQKWFAPSKAADVLDVVARSTFKPLLVCENKQKGVAVGERTPDD